MAIMQLQQTKSRCCRAEETKIINGTPVRFRDICVHNIYVNDVEDHVIIFSQMLNQWQQTDAGKFVIEHSVEKPYWARAHGTNYWGGHTYRIIARLSEQNQTYWLLKWFAIN